MSAANDQSIDTNITTLSTFILNSQKELGTTKNATGDLTLLLNSLQFAFKFISHTINKSELINLIGVNNTINSTGDVQKKLDVLGDEIFINAMRNSGKVKVLVSEEQEDLIIFDEATGAKYCVCCDPIDGSSNIDAGVSVGTIVSVFKIRENSDGTIHDVLRSGDDMVVACYAMYGASTHLMITFGNGLNGFTLDTSLGEFILTYKDMKLPELRSIYSINEGNYSGWAPEIQNFIDDLKKTKQYNARYIGSMVADVHRTLLYGGLFSYPADGKNKNGKLRLLYEAFPMALIVEQAGGKAVNDKGKRILDLTPKNIHDKSSIWLGSSGEVDKYLSYIKK
ncbi:probable Fructose-1,6-bisphosphatase [Saccharomycodes ludwigii]|uniref:Fructose-1,6-bisphosphatase n=1 Tax=Saccharomycodes ludwigii TaxID=36035 RepID=A0A376B4X0_9ASCO|nr:hypothetical protein SCDLUD_004226 [Saccharomycodes ludwigii]KAH3899913.1 hypothetical protein SCDLUD_004226 [Saccharomycodes ludwigii]SSD59180.1 probable Fructose-1,6-bisphosphatase [Saccharomycodes ludwigii]